MNFLLFEIQNSNVLVLSCCMDFSKTYVFSHLSAKIWEHFYTYLRKKHTFYQNQCCNNKPKCRYLYFLTSKKTIVFMSYWKSWYFLLFFWIFVWLRSIDSEINCKFWQSWKILKSLRIIHLDGKPWKVPVNKKNQR
jgi:hypothetical protein